MTATLTTTSTANHIERAGVMPARRVVHDAWVIARRGLTHIRRQPEMLTDATIQPVMFVLLFAYVFGKAVPLPDGGNYREYMMGGIFAQTIVLWNPVTTLANAVRIQFGNPVADQVPSPAWSIQHPALYTALWVGGIVLVCAPLAVRAYNRSIQK